MRSGAKLVSALRFRRVLGTAHDIDALYKILKARQVGISHVSVPNWPSHRQFVLNHPYRFWYIIERETTVLGSLYFQFDNSIGVSMPGQPSKTIQRVLDQALKLHRPLKALKSLRSNHFFVNVSPEEHTLRRALRNMGWATLQITYAANNRSPLGAICV
jgi:hypothetical protein